MDADTFSPKGYRLRAAALRDEANKTTNLETKHAMQNIAANYEALAKRVEKSST